MAYWLLKSEPSAFSWQRLQKDGKAMWDGVRNYQARNNLRAMQVGDLGFFYHSVDERQIVGVVRVVKTAYPDPTAPGEDWSVVEVVPVAACPTPVTLAAIKAHPKLQEMALLKQSRLSVCPVRTDEWRVLCALGGVKV
jgi:predicted RNA-binding protein with PUA-like domain